MKKKKASFESRSKNFIPYFFVMLLHAKDFLNVGSISMEVTVF
jgi:hypothetical protein